MGAVAPLEEVAAVDFFKSPEHPQPFDLVPLAPLLWQPQPQGDDPPDAHFEQQASDFSGTTLRVGFSS
jgi:hypothetical protein